MALNRKLVTDLDLKEAMERQVRIRIFQDDRVVESGGIISRFDEASVVIQSGVSDINYYPRASCEIFEIKK
ncbi:hypothetical protein D3C73_718040 [compost metagenome]